MKVEFLVSIKHPDDAEPMFLTEEQAKEVYDALHARFGDFDQARELSQLARESVARELRIAQLEATVKAYRSGPLSYGPGREAFEKYLEGGCSENDRVMRHEWIALGPTCADPFPETGPSLEDDIVAMIASRQRDPNYIVDVNKMVDDAEWAGLEEFKPVAPSNTPEPPAETGPSLQDDIEAMIAKKSKNGEELRIPSLVLNVDGLDQTLLTTPDYWDCECDENYIHFHQVERCTRCGAERDSQPDARVFELLKHAPEDAAWTFIDPDGLTVPLEVIDERLRVYAESLRDPFAPDDADEQEAEFLSRLPLSEVCQLPPIKCPSNTPEPPAPSNDRQVRSPRTNETDPEKCVRLWMQYRAKYPKATDSEIVSRVRSHVKRLTNDEVRSILRECGLAVADPTPRREVILNARAESPRGNLPKHVGPKPPLGYRIVDAEAWKASAPLLNESEIRELAECGLARIGLAVAE